MKLQNIDLKSPRYDVGTKVFYPFTHEAIVIEAYIEEASIRIHSGRASYDYTLTTKEGKTYRTFESDLYLDKNSASLVIDEVKVKNTEKSLRKLERLDGYLKYIKNKLLDAEPVKENVKQLRQFAILGHQFNYFDKGESVFLYVPDPWCLSLEDNYEDVVEDCTVFEGVVRGVSGAITSSTQQITYSINYNEWYATEVKPERIFYSENDALLFAKEVIENEIVVIIEKTKKS